MPLKLSSSSPVRGYDFLFQILINEPQGKLTGHQVSFPLWFITWTFMLPIFAWFLKGCTYHLQLQLHFSLNRPYNQWTNLWTFSKDVDFFFPNRDFKVRLTRDTSVFLPDFTLVTSDGEEQSPDVSYFYSGDLEGWFSFKDTRHYW